MYQKDYILRMMEMLAEMLAAIMGFIKNGKFDASEKAIENAYKALLHEDAAFFQAIPIQKLTETLLEIHNYTNGHLQILSELFFAEAELQLAIRKEFKSLELFKKSLILLEFLDNELKSYSMERLSKIETIKQRIAQLSDNQ